MEEKPQPNEDLKTEFIVMLKGVDPPERCEVHEQSIYKVPPSIRELHPQVYTPKIISIGPFHNLLGRPSDPNEDKNILLRSMEDLKLKYLKGFLNRIELSVEDFVSKFKELELENRIRNSYAGGPVIFKNNNDFLKIIITDGCFIVELFLRNSEGEHYWKNDPILSKPWLFNHILADLILLENQLPFFVLEEIYEFAGLESPSFLIITTHFFQVFNKHKINTERESPKHFVDLVRIFLKPSAFVLGQKKENNPVPCCSQCTSVFQLNFYYLPKEQENIPIDHVYSASQLSDAGLKFKVSKDEDSKCLLDLKFDDKKGVLKMPCFHVDDTTEIHLGNILAFEECHYPDSGYINQYMAIIDYLINAEKDVNILIDSGIIVNLMGDASLVATVITNLNKNISMQDLNSDYLSLANRLNAFYKNPLNKYKAALKSKYFSTPWKTASTTAAVLLLLLTLLQTIFTVLDFHQDK